jgi:RimJ/RimL family protein N-acetyltransferase
VWVERIEDHPGLVYPVALNMREWDKREIYANRFHDDPMTIAKEAIALGQQVGWVSGLGEQPIAAFGCHLMWPGVWSMWLFATDNFRHIGISMTKLIKHRILPMLWEADAHRLEARSMEGHTDAQRWLEVIGARREATLKAYGRAGEDFHVYTWGRP